MKYIRWIFIGSVILWFIGCGTPKNTYTVEQSLPYAHKMQPNDKSDILYIYSNGDIKWEVHCMANGNPLGNFNLKGGYQIARIYKDVGNHLVQCQFQTFNGEPRGVTESIMINVKGNNKHFIEIIEPLTLFGEHSAKIVSGDSFDPNKLGLTKNCFDCYQTAPKRYMKMQ
jgi:hypothetical protein